MASWRVYVRRVPQWVRLLLLVPLFYGVWLVSLTGEGGGRDSDSLASLGGGGGGHGGQRKPLGAYATGHDDTSVPRVTKRKLPLVEALEMTEVRKSPPLMCPVINPAPFDGLVQMNPAFIIIGKWAHQKKKKKEEEGHSLTVVFQAGKNAGQRPCTTIS